MTDRSESDPQGWLRRAIIAPANLLTAWEAVASNAATSEATDDRITNSGAHDRSAIDRFAADALNRLQSLADELASGEYTPGDLYRVDIEKRSGDPFDIRTLRIPTVKDRIVERSIMQVFTPLVDPWLSPWSFAFRPGLSRFDALHALAIERDRGATTVVKADIDDCFDTLPPSRVIADAAELLQPHDSDGWVTQMITAFVTRAEHHKGARRERSIGVPQGSPLAPMLANIYLDRLDRMMAAYGWPTIRYADDLVIPLNDRSEAVEAEERMQLALVALNLAANEGSVEVMDFSEGFVFLGEEVNAKYPEVSEHVRRSKPDRMSMYVGTQGAYVHVRKGRVTVSKNHTELGEAPVKHVARLVCFGNITLAPSFRSYAVNAGIDVTFLSRRGTFAGRLDSHPARNAEILMAQVNLADEVRLELARSIVLGKVANMRSLLARYQRRVTSPLLAGAVAQLGDMRAMVARATTIDQLMGHEGASTKCYWDAFGTLLPDPWEWNGRHRQPPPDPVNALLSFGYAVLTGQVEGAVVSAGLEPSIGVFHRPQGRRPSLALDLMEEFRPLIVDMVVLDVLRRNKMKADSFRPSDGGGVLLTDAARKRYLAALENRMLTVFSHVPSGKKVSYRYALFLQAQQMKGLIRSSATGYVPVSWR